MTTSTKAPFTKHPKEIKDQVLKRIREDGIPVAQVAEEHGIATQTIYFWLGKDVKGGPSWADIARLKRENKQLLELVGELTMKLSQGQKKS